MKPKLYKCPICDKKHNHDTGIEAESEDGIELSNTRLCLQDMTLFDSGYVALVVAETKNNSEHHRQPESNIYRTGEVTHINRFLLSGYGHITETPTNVPMIFIDKPFYDYILSEEQHVNSLH